MDLLLLLGNHSQGAYLGCFKDDQKDRDLHNFNIDFKEDNSPQKCIDYCLRGGKFCEKEKKLTGIPTGDIAAPHYLVLKEPN